MPRRECVWDPATGVRVEKLDDWGVFAMIRVFLAAAALAAFSVSSRGEETEVRLNVYPMPAPKPALKYQLLPCIDELNSGNAAQDYLKCFMEQRAFFYSKEAVSERARYLALPLGELPAAELRSYGGGVLRRADWAARLEIVDWQHLDRIKDGGIEETPGDLGPLQSLASALQVRFRAEVAGHHFDDALRGAKTMFALSRHLGEYPREVAHVEGMAIAHLALGTLEEMVQQPGCPNLYWALTALPCPLVELRKGLQGDCTRVANELRPLRDDASMTQTGLEMLLSHLSGVLGLAREHAGLPIQNLRAVLSARVKDPERVAAARRCLVEAGYAEDRVKALPLLQLILLEEKRNFEIERDERLKLLALPLWQVEALDRGVPCGNGDPLSNQAQDERRTSVIAMSRSMTSERDCGGVGLFAELLPRVVKLRQTQAQLERQIAMLRFVEALRLYAAEHHGKLPAAASEIALPLADDPFTGKPLEYALEGPSAHIRAHQLAGARRSEGFNVHYVVTIQK
jgi:hypothetical protein